MKTPRAVSGMGCAASTHHVAAQEWRRNHTDDKWFARVVEDWAARYATTLERERAELDARSNALEEDPAALYCDLYARKRGGHKHELTYRQYMRSHRDIP